MDVLRTVVDAVQQFAKSDVERLGEPDQRPQAWLAPAPLKQRYGGSVQTRLETERLLREADTFAL